MRTFGFGYALRITVAAALATLALASCVKEESVDGKEAENHSLNAWIKKNRPDLLGNKQANGAYYVDVLAWGDETDAGDDNDFGDKPIMEQDSVWLFYNLTGRDLDGNVCLNRNEALARMQGTFSLQTHYVPYMNYAGKVNAYALLEATYLATRNEITLGEQYVADHADICKSTTLKLHRGTKVRIYAPSTIAYGSSGTSTSGGYEGQYTLDGNVPMIMDIEIVRAIKNPSDLEIGMLKDLVGAPDEKSDGANGWTLALRDKSDDDSTDDSTDDDKDDGKLKGLYYNLLYEPNVNNVGLRHVQSSHKDTGVSNPYKDSDKYADMVALDQKIDEILAEKFKGKVLDKSQMTDDNLIKKSGAATIWYVTRFLDGFVLDSNIPEIKELVFDSAGSSSAISYTADSNASDYISAWEHCIPKMHYGQWAAILTASGYAYGSTGISGTTTTSSSGGSYYYPSYYDYYNGYNSMYYGNAYYGGYYGYGYPSYISTGTSSSVDTSTIDTEVLGYTPLLFYIYIEPQAK